MVSWGLRILAGLLLLPPLTPLGLLVWWWARKREKKAKQQREQAENIAKLADNADTNTDT